MSGKRAVPSSTSEHTDLVGLCLLGSLAGWLLVSAATRGGSAADVVLSLAVIACAYALGRATARWSWAIAGTLLTCFCSWTILSNGAFSGGPLAGPLHYANANAALAVQVSGVALIASARCRPARAKVPLIVLAVLPLAMTWVNRSAAGMTLGVALLLVGIYVAVRPPASARPAVLVVGILLGACVVGQLLIASGVGDQAAARALSERRVDLWTDAAKLAQDQPVFGHGPGSFATASPTAASDADTQAAHSALLQMAAETGIVGAALLLLLVAWAYLALARGVDPGPAVVGVAAWTAFAVHSLVDYVANFPAVLAVAGLALGLAVGPLRQKSSMSPSVSDHAARAGG